MMSTFKSLCLCLWLATVQAQWCTENFKNMVSSGGNRKGETGTIQTRLIPSMRFTCSGTIVAFTVTGRTSNGVQDPKIQIWRENKAQCGTYQKSVPEIVINCTSCSNLTQLESVMPAEIFYCVLNNSSQASVQYGDILGIELPPANDSNFDLYLTEGGPLNYVFQQQLSSTVNTTTKSSVVEEQPQVTLEINSDFQCTSGYPAAVTSDGTGRGTRSTVVTRLIPDLKFTCDGIITQYTVAGVTSYGTKEPKIQIWRERPNRCGTYIKIAKDIATDTSVCEGNAVERLSAGVFQCSLKERFRVQVQAGDILGLELPPPNDRDFVVRFTSGGPTNYVFESQLSSAVNLSGRTSEVQEQPQINITVEVLFPTATEATTAVLDNNFTTQNTTTTTDTSSTNNNNMDNQISISDADLGLVLIIGSAAGGIVGIILLSAVGILTVALVCLARKHKKHLRGRETSIDTTEDRKALDVEVPLKENQSYIPIIKNAAYGETVNRDNNYEIVDPCTLQSQYHTTHS